MARTHCSTCESNVLPFPFFLLSPLLISFFTFPLSLPLWTSPSTLTSSLFSPTLFSHFLFLPLPHMGGPSHLCMVS